MADKVLINLATGLEDSERVTIAFLTGGAALERGREGALFLTKEAVRLCEPGHAVGVAGGGWPPRAAGRLSDKGRRRPRGGRATRWAWGAAAARRWSGSSSSSRRAAAC